MKTIVALYDDFSDAQAVVRDLVQSGVARKNVSLVTIDHDETYARELEDFDDENGNYAAEGAGAGAVAGTLLGGTGGFLVGLGALAIPGIGPIVAAGPLAAALVGAGVGAAAGGIIGALIGWGIPEEEAGYYAEGIRRGGTLVGVAAPDEDVDLVSEVLNKYEPVDLETRSTTWRKTGWTRFDENAQPYTAGTTSADLATTRGTYARAYDYQTPGRFDDVEYDDDYYESYEPSYRKHFDTTYRNTGSNYGDYQNAYRFGSMLSVDSRYNDYSDWNDLEPIARSRWEETHTGTWDRFRDAVQYGWYQMQEAVR